MQGKRSFDRADYGNDSEFEHAIDQAAKPLDIAGKRHLMFSLMRQCRGCGVDTTYGSLEVRRSQALSRLSLACKVCARAVPIDSLESIGRAVTLWNTTPLTIEARNCA